MKLSELLRPIERVASSTTPLFSSVASADCLISELHNDSRNISPGCLFIAYPGAATDGRLYMQQAVQAGAVAIIYDPIDLPASLVLPKTIPCIPLPHLSSSLATLACQFYGHPTQSMSITGVTGTNGKTTIAYQLAQAHQLLGHSSAYIGTIGQGHVSQLKPLINTTPDALHLQRLFHDYQQQSIDHVCMEVSSHALSEGRVEAVDFDHAIFTNLSLDHLDYHHTMQAYAEAKALLFAMPTLQWAIINQDDPYSVLMASARSRTCQKLTYGLQDGCDVQARDCRYNMTGSDFDIHSPWGTRHVHVKSIGAFNIYNSLVVYSSLLAHGYAIDDVVTVMAQLNPSPGRMEIVAKEPIVLVDYAHTPDALENVLSTLVRLKSQHDQPCCLWVIFGCGGDRDKTKRPVMGRIASQLADRVVLTSDNPRTEDPALIIDDIARGVLPTANVEIMPDRREAIHHVLQLAKQDDIILIAGKGHEAYQQIGTQRFDFSDQDEVRAFFKNAH